MIGGAATSLADVRAERLRRQVERDADKIRDRCRTLRGFVREAWQVLEPVDQYVHGWHIDVICEHLEAVTHGDIIRLVVNVPTGTMKPVAESEFVVEQRRGRICLRDVVVGDEILTHKGRFRRVLEVHRQGVLPTVVVRTGKGRCIRTAPDHPFLTTRGWVVASDLVSGDVVGAVRPQEEIGTATISEDEARLLGYLVGDGCTKFAQITVTNMDAGVIEDVHRCAKALGFVTKERIKKNCRAVTVCILAGLNRRHTRARNPLRFWLRNHELEGKSSYTKRVPPAVMAGNERIVAAFLGAYWSCDGHVTKGVDRARLLVADTVGAGLAADIQHLCLRMGASSQLYTKARKLKSKRQGGEFYVSHRITVDGGDGYRFRNVPIAHRAKRDAVASILARKFNRVLAEDRVVAVESAEPTECRCLTVDEDSSFTAGDIAVHNSFLVSVFHLAWEWGPMGLSHLREISTSHSEKFVKRDCRRTRDLIASEWYRTLWPNVRLTRMGETSFANDRTGFREGIPFESLTGGRGHRLKIDDPHTTETAESNSERERVARIFRESVPSRVIDPKTSAIVLIMQRLHGADCSALALEQGYVHVMLPMEFEPERRCYTVLPRRDVEPIKARYLPRHQQWIPDDWTGTDPALVRDFEVAEPKIVYAYDQRTRDGELLFPERFPRQVVERDKAAMGPYAHAAQNQQRPAPRQGNLFQKHWFKYGAAAPQPVRRVRAWDLAATEQIGGNDPSWTVGVLMSRDAQGLYYIEDVIRMRATPGRVEQAILNAAALDNIKFPTRIRLPQDPGAAGKAHGQYLVRALSGYNVTLKPVSGAKITRWEPFASQCEAGNVTLIEGIWNADYLDELSLVPAALHDDQADASADAFHELVVAPPAPMFGRVIGQY